MIGRVRVFGLTSFAKVEIGASAALEANACYRRLLASITCYPMMNNLGIDRLTKLEQRMFGRMHG